jgi:hypothetical protein
VNLARSFHVQIERLESSHFAVEGLNPRRTRTLSFHHREKVQGKVMTIRGDIAEELTVQLEPCGEVVARVVDASGKSVTDARFRLGAMITASMPGPRPTGRDVFAPTSCPGWNTTLAQ